MEPLRFSALIEKSGASTIIRLPFDPNEVWSSRARHHVAGTINGRVFRGPLIGEDAHYFFSLGAAWRRDNPLEAGTVVEVVLSPEGPLAEQLAPDVTSALASAPSARTFFEGLATFYRKGYLRWIDGAKRPETRAARIAEVVRLLKAGQKQR